MKKCKKCNEVKTNDEYKSVTNYNCLECNLQCKRDWHIKNKEKENQRCREYRKENATVIAIKYKKYCENNKEKINQIARNYRDNHIGSKLRGNLSRRLRQKINKNDLTSSYLGTNIGIIKKWLESNFTYEMNWDNYGSFWHIDHVFPINKFDLEDSENIAICFNWKNLYPMNASDNISKSDNIHPKSLLFQELKIQKFCIHNKIQDNITEYFQKYNYIATHLEAGNPLEP